MDASAKRRYEGTGLGLVICQRLIHAMGGRIWLESDAGQGSEFGFTIWTKLIGQKLVRGNPDPDLLRELILKLLERPD